jgi:tRNA1Val (adenine37-N6)-methyltransferase
MNTFKFKYFSIEQADYAHPVGTDAMVLGALVNQKQPNRILDIGTGTGVLALMMGQRFPNASITGLEKNTAAAALAEKNFRQSPYASALTVKAIDFCDYAQSNNETFDLIITNPPYFKSSTLAQGNERNMARHQESLSIEQLLDGVKNLLSEHGVFWLILPKEQAERVVDYSNTMNLQVRIKLFGKPQKHVRDILMFSRKSNNQVEERELTIRDSDGNYTDQYKAITRDFHGVTL